MIDIYDYDSMRVTKKLADFLDKVKIVSASPGSFYRHIDEFCHSCERNYENCICGMYDDNDTCDCEICVEEPSDKEDDIEAKDVNEN